DGADVEGGGGGGRLGRGRADVRRGARGGLQRVRPPSADLRGGPVSGTVLLQRRTPSPLQPVNKPAAQELLLPPGPLVGTGAEAPSLPESFWVSLRYFNAYRIAVAALFLLSALVYGDKLSFRGQEAR